MQFTRVVPLKMFSHQQLNEIKMKKTAVTCIPQLQVFRCVRGECDAPPADDPVVVAFIECKKTYGTDLLVDFTVSFTHSLFISTAFVFSLQVSINTHIHEI